nr:polynucleotide adenylyltransferase family protein [Tanacetum cinerariifolium]
MTTAITNKHNPFLSHIKTLFSLQCFYHKFVEAGHKSRPRNNRDSVIEPEKWKKMDSRALGITRTMIPSSPYTLLKILRTKGDYCLVLSFTCVVVSLYLVNAVVVHVI